MTVPPTYDGNDDHDDPLAARLRAALTSEADMVNPSDDGLQKVRLGVESAHRPWWRHPAAPALVAAAVLGLMAGGIAVAVNGDDDEGGNVTAGQPSATGTGTASASPSPSESTSAPAPMATDQVYVYYVMDDGKAPRLYREQHKEQTAGNNPSSGLSSMFGTPPDDPDYASAWPTSAHVLDYQVSGDTATVDVSDFVDLGSEAETVAVQELVYTVTANDTSVKKVRLLVDGQAPTSGHHDWSEPISRAPMVDVQGFVWLLGPTEGATVSSPVDITGYGTAFEGTVSWEVRREGAEDVVADGFTQAGANGEFDEFGDSVELEPGTYEIRAFESSAEDGTPTHVDTKTFTVE